jgi:hypothetical protein
MFISFRPIVFCKEFCLRFIVLTGQPRYLRFWRRVKETKLVVVKSASRGFFYPRAHGFKANKERALAQKLLHVKIEVTG